MTMNAIDTRFWHQKYEEDEERAGEDAVLVNAMYDAASKVMKARDRKPANDDRAEKVIAALMEFVVESKTP